MTKSLLWSLFLSLCWLGFSLIIIMCEIKLGSLNINGAREDTKRASLFTLIKSKNLNVTFLQETHSSLDNESDWKREWGGEVILSHKSNTSGGVGIFFSADFLPSSFSVEEVVPGRQLKLTAEFEKIVFINVYAPSLSSERILFLDVLKDVLSNCSSEEYLFLGGDYNCTEDPVLDRNHPEPHAASRSCLSKMIEHFELCDVWRFFHKHQQQYTWSHCKDNMLSLARLDRVYSFEHHVSVFKGSCINPVGISDHALVQCSILIKNIKCKSAYWHFNSALLSDNIFKNVFRSFWSNHRLTKHEYSSLQQWWDVGKVKIKQLCLQYTLKVTKDMARSMRALEREVVELQGLADSTGDREWIQVLKSKKSALSDLLGISAQGALIRSGFQNVVKMDAPSHFFFSLECKNGHRRLIHSLRSDTGQLLQESADIRQCAVGFYENLYKIEFQEDPEVAQSFYEGLPQVPKEDNAELEAQLSAQELQEALGLLCCGTGWRVWTLLRTCCPECKDVWWTFSGTACTGPHRASSFCPRRREDKDLSTWRAEELPSGSSLFKDS